MPDLIGQTIGRYKILEELGSGGMAIVYKAHDTRLKTDVAVKFILTENLPQIGVAHALKRFEREAEILARLTHPNIVPIIDYGEFEGRPYLVMKYLPGGTLQSFLNGQPMSWQEAARLLIPVARALDCAHHEGTVHRDVKPTNILFTSYGEPMLTDFGIAKIINEEVTLGLTGTSATIGTPFYMAPEQVSSKSVDGRADIYSLGIVFYEMVTGRKPFIADTPMAVLFKHANEPLPSPKQFVPGLPRAVEKVLFKALAKKPDDRYQTMAEFALALEQLTGGQTTKVVRKLEEKRKVEEKTLPIGGSAEKDIAETLAAGGSGKKEGEETRKVPVHPKPNTSPGKWARWLPWAGIATLTVLAIILIFIFTNQKPIISSPNAALPIGTISSVVVTKTTVPLPTSTYTIFPTDTVFPTDTPIPSVTPTPEPSPGIGSIWIRPADGMVMLYVPEGNFSMGANESSLSDQRPQHTVYLDAFWIDKTDITNVMYEKCVEVGICISPSRIGSSLHASYYGNSLYNNYPVININWAQADTFCKWAGAKLPTEAEWEKTARGIDARIYPWGNDSPNCSFANYEAGAHLEGNQWITDPCVGDPSEVGHFPSGASPYGAMDMAGNVWQWVADRYEGNYYSKSPRDNPTGPDHGDRGILRGGSWVVYGDVDIQSAYRYPIDPTSANNFIGFRCARSAK